VLAVEGWPVARQDEAVVSLGAGDHPVVVPVFPPRAAEGGDVGYDRIWPCPKVVGTKMVPSLPRLDQHKEVAEQGSTGGHTYEHLVEVDEDGRLEDGVGRKVLKLEPKLLQHQQEERRDPQCQPAGDVGDKQHELLDSKVAEGSRASVNRSGEPWRTPPEQATHRVERRLRLEAVGVAERSHGVCGCAGVELRSAKAKGHRRRRGRRTKEHEGERAQSNGREYERVTVARGGETFFKETRVLAQGNPSARPSIAVRDHA
jgi:hypothetical protein